MVDLGRAADWGRASCLSDSSGNMEIDLRVKERVKECEKFAEESPFPEKNIMYDSVYEQQNYPFLKHKI